jgi:drug/metabolite transporter (DMT)-like permease
MLRSQRQHAIAVVVIALVAIIFGCGFAAIQTVLRGGLSVGAALSVRFGLGSIGLGLLLWLRHEKFDRASLRDGVVLGMLLVVIFWLQTDGLRFTTTSKSGLITSLYVPFTPLLALFLRERIKVLHGVGAVLATLGLFFLVHVPGSMVGGWNRGDFETLLCALLCAVHLTLTSRYAQRSNSWVLALMQLVVTGGISIVITALLPAPHGFQNVVQVLQKPDVLVAMTFMVLFSTMFSFWGMSTMQAYLLPTEAAVIFSLEPVVATLVGVFWVGERFLSSQIAGAGLIVLAMLATELLPRFLPSDDRSEALEATD